MKYTMPDIAGVAGGAASSARLSQVDQTELQALLHTVTDQAYEIRSLAHVVLDRVCPQPEPTDDCAESLTSGGYVGQAERLRTTQREIIEVLTQLAKYA
jgi:hypothetical protein